MTVVSCIAMTTSEDSCPAFAGMLQGLELACFVEQVSPQAMQQVAGLLSKSAVGLATFGTSAALLFLPRLDVGVGGA